MLVILLKKSGYDTKIKDIKNKYISTTKFNKLATDAVNAQIAQANLVKKTDFDNKLSDLNRKIVSNKRKDLLVAKQLSYLHGRSYFDEDNNKIIIYFNQFLNI